MGDATRRRRLSVRVRLAFDMVPGLDQQVEQRLDEYAELARPARNNPWVSSGILKAFGMGLEAHTAQCSNRMKEQPVGRAIAGAR